VLCTQPGIVLESKVREGQSVAAGDVLFVLGSETTSEGYGDVQQTIAALLQSRRDSLSSEQQQLQRQTQDRTAAAQAQADGLALELDRIAQQRSLQRHRVDLAETELKRFVELRDSGYVSAMQLQDKQAELARVTADLGERSATADSQRVEATALRVQVDALKERVSGHEHEAHEIGDRLMRERRDAAAATAELTEARGKVEKLSDRVMELERALVAQTTEAEILGRRVQEMETRMVEQGKLLSERELELARLNENLTAGKKTETDLRAELAHASDRARTATEGLTKEKALMEDQLSQAKADRTKLQQEIAAMKREAEQTWAAERVENALLRERINDIAAEIARLTVALEGADSPIEAMLLAEPAVNGQRPTNGERKPAAAAGDGKGKGNLADRIRALQLKASRVPATN